MLIIVEYTIYRIANKKSVIDILFHPMCIRDSDRDTSGLMMFAKNQRVQKALQSNWNSAITQRSYVAVVEGRPEKDHDLIVSNLVENAKMQVYVTAKGDGKEAITRYHVLHLSLIHI